MAWRYHNYECGCGRVFECLVDNRDFVPDPCPDCGKEGATLLPVGRVNHISSYVPDYPGANIHRAGFAELRRPPEKKGRQVSMVKEGKRAKNDVPAPTKAAKASKSSKTA